MQVNNVKDLFKQFCKERHAEDKGRNFDMLQEIYANTELFDLSFLPKGTPDMSPFEPKLSQIQNEMYDDNLLNNLKGRNEGLLYNSKQLEINDYTIFTDDYFKNISIPFESQFVKLGKAGMYDNVCFMIREYEPTILSGSVYVLSEDFTLNMPFHINTEDGQFLVSLQGIKVHASLLNKLRLSKNVINKITSDLITITLGLTIYSINTICNLPKHSVVSDTPKRNEYYTRKHGSTIKVCKPIYYVLNKDEEKEKITYKRIKPLGHLAFDHSFKVIGHWRRISPHTYGKNRQGEYIVTGMTWVKEHTRGEGELMKKIRVVK